MRFILRSRQNIPTSDRAKGKREAKQEIRTQFHRQLQNMWLRTQFLKDRLDGLDYGDVVSQRIRIAPGKEFYGGILKGESGKEYKFIPLLTVGGPWVCDHLDFRFLIRQDKFDTMDPYVGDMDERLSVVFDALRIPHQKTELDEQKDRIDNPCHVLLEDESLVRRVTAETMQLLNDPNDNSDRRAVPDQDHVVHVLVTLRRREKHSRRYCDGY